MIEALEFLTKVENGINCKCRASLHLFHSDDILPREGMLVLKVEAYVGKDRHASELIFREEHLFDNNVLEIMRDMFVRDFNDAYRKAFSDALKVQSKGKGPTMA